MQVPQHNKGCLTRETLSIPEESQVTAITIQVGRCLCTDEFCSLVFREKSGLFPDKQNQSLLIQITSVMLSSMLKLWAGEDMIYVDIQEQSFEDTCMLNKTLNAGPMAM